MQYKLLIALLFAVFPLTVFSQQDEPETVSSPVPKSYYAEIVTVKPAAARSASVNIDFGRVLPAAVGMPEKDVRTLVQNLNFATALDALNYMAQRGWRLVDTYTLSTGPNSATHMLLEYVASEPGDVMRSLMNSRD